MAVSFALNIPFCEEQPIRKIIEMLVIGSQEGDVLLDDPSVDTKHCSFIVNDDVISIIDHNSSMGTFIGSDRIPSEKMIILMEGDTIKFGEIEAKLIAQDIGDEEGANVLLYSLGDSAKGQGKSVEQLIVDQIIGEVASSVQDSELLQNAHEETKVMKRSEHEYDLSEDEATGDIEIPHEFKTLKVGDNIEGDANGEIDVSQLSGNNKEQVLYRLMAVVIELALAYAMYFFILGDFLSSIISELINSFKSVGVVGLLLSDLKPLISVYIVYALLRLITSYLLGVSYIQKALGFFAHTEKSILSLLRELIGLILGPFLIGDIFLLKGSFTLKENLSKSFISLDNKKRAIVYGVLLLPLSISLAFVSPLFVNLKLPQSYLISNQAVSKNQTDTNTLYQNSIFLGIKISEKFSLDNIIYPLVLIKGKSFEYQFKGINLKQKKSFTFSSEPHDFLVRVLNEMMEKDPLFQFNFPIIYKVLVEGYKNTDVTESELLSIFQASFKLDFYSSFKHLLDFGPFFNSYLTFRKNILEGLGITDLKQISLVNLHGQKYLSFASPAATGGTQQLLIPISFNMKKTYKIISQVTPVEMEKLTTLLWANSRVLPLTQLESVEIEPIDSFSLIDYLKKTRGKNEELSMYLLSTMEKLKARSYESGDELAKRNFKQSLNSIIKYVTRHLELKAQLPQTDTILSRLMELNSDE